jgi:hypothetical protein
MRKVESRRFAIAAIAVVSLVMLASIGSSKAVDKSKSESIEANARGQGSMLGKIVNIYITINEYSTPEDQQILIQAFESKGMEGLTNAVSKMKSKGRIMATGTLGYDINYIRNIPSDGGGRKIRMVTDRPILFGEAWADSRSMDYTLAAIELDLSDAKGKNTGILLPACKFKIDKEKQLAIENYDNPWKLEGVKDKDK